MSAVSARYFNNGIDFAFFEALEMARTIPKFTVERNVVAIGQELVYVRTRAYNAMRYVNIL